MWAFITMVFSRLLDTSDTKLTSVLDAIKRLEQTMSEQTEKILTDLNAVKANLEEAQGDLAEVMALNQQQTAHITTLEQAIADLQAQVGDLAALDAIGAAVADIRATSRAIADVVPEPEPEPPAE